MENPTVEPALRVEFRESRVGNEMLLINGCRYMVNRRSGETVYWRCVYSWCHSRAVIKAGQLCSARGEHVCPQPLQNEVPTNEEKPQLQPNSVAGLPENVISKYKFDSLSETGDSTTERLEANGSFLEFVEDKSVLTKTEASDDQVCDADIAWKNRILKGLSVYSEAEQLRRFKVAHDNRKAWLRNKKYLNEKISGCITKWTNSNATWAYSNDWPTRSHCMKLTKPVRGTGVFVEQPLVPIKIIEHVNPPSQEQNVPEESEFYDMEQTAVKKESVKNHRDKINRIRKGIADENGGDSRKIAMVKNEAIKRFRNEGKCPICGKMFQSSIERHLNVHYGIKPYKCEHCDKEHSYRAHVRIHNSDTPFSCTICPKKFTSNGTLKRHVMSHSNGRTFPCNFCGKVFRKSESLDLHTCKFQAEQKNVVKSKAIEDEKRETCLRTRRRRSIRIKRKKIMPGDEETLEEDYKNKLSKTIDLHLSEEAFMQRLDHPHHYEEAESSRSAICKLSLDEFKYADFLQPRVVLSKSLSVTITQMMYEAEISETRQTAAINNLWFHNYAKPF